MIEYTPEEPLLPQTVVIDGYICDAETGEVVGIEAPYFAIDSEEAANWVLEKMLQSEADMASVDSTAAVIHARAILANADKLKKDHVRRLDYLHRRFDNELGEYARVQLEGKKAKTLKTLFGAISIRVKKGGLRVKDPTFALMAAKSLGCTNAIETSHVFKISQLTDAQREVIAGELQRRARSDPGMYSETVLNGFALEPDSETVTIKTGVEA